MPGQVAAAARAARRRVFMVGLEGFADPAVLAPWPHEVIRILAAGRILAALREHGCQDLVLVGPVRRPSLLDLRPDAEGARMLARIGRAAFAGDDGLLAAVVRVLGEEGFRVVGAHEILNEALGPAGLLSRAAPDALAMADIRRGSDRGRVRWARSMSARAAWCSRAWCWRSRRPRAPTRCWRAARALARPGPGGVLVKLVKPGQDRRADLPTIGPETVRARGGGRAARGCVRGRRHHPGRARAAIVAAADAAGLFLLGLDPDAPVREGSEHMSRFLHTMLRVGDLSAASISTPRRSA